MHKCLYVISKKIISSTASWEKRGDVSRKKNEQERAKNRDLNNSQFSVKQRDFQFSV